MTYPEALAYLDSFINFERKTLQPYVPFKLRRVKRLLARLGDPQQAFRIVHIAGSKGKGSTAAYVSYILAAAGCRTGLYTSPHLSEVRERIRVLTPDGLSSGNVFEGMIVPGDFAALLDGMKPALEVCRRDDELGELTYFEVLTAAALVYFRQRRVDIAVLEAGMGGRLDATNAVGTDVAVLTTIGFDHMKFLGGTLTEIATEKAAIIKGPPQAVVCVPQPAEAMAVIRQRCGQLGSSLKVIDEDRHLRVKERSLTGDLFTLEGIWDTGSLELATSLPGRNQRINAAAAVATTDVLRRKGVRIGAEDIILGVRAARWPGRVEWFDGQPPVLLDGAHTVDSARDLVEMINTYCPRRQVTFVLGMSGDKDVIGMCRIFAGAGRQLVLTRSAHPRAFDFAGLDRSVLPPGVGVADAAGIRQALTLARSLAGPDGLVVVSGSLFIVGEARELCVQNTQTIPS